MYLRFLLMVWVALAGAATAYGQVQLLPLNTDQFAEAYTARLGEINRPAANEAAQVFSIAWADGTIRNEDKLKIVRQANRLLKEGWRLFPHVTQYMETALAVRNNTSPVRIPLEEFYPVTDSVVTHHEQKQALAYLGHLAKFAKEQDVYNNQDFRWRITSTDARLDYHAEWVKDTPVDSHQIYYPRLKLAQTDLQFIMETDTATIRRTSGGINLFTTEFVGNGGTYGWDYLGLPGDSVYVDLYDFRFNLNGYIWRADSVLFHYTGFLPKNLNGTFHENYADFPPGENTDNYSFPYFRSTEGGITIENFIPNVTYKGGFSLKGTTRIGTRTRDDFAELTIYKAGEDRRVLHLLSDEYQLNTVALLTDKAQVTLYLPGGDTLYHPEMRLYYQVDSQDITLKIDRKSRNSRQPIISSHHDYNLYFDAILWNPKDDTVALTAVLDKEHKIFAIESIDFFRMHLFRQYQGVMNFNPLAFFYFYYRDVLKRRSTTLFLTEFLKHYKLEKQRRQLELAMPDLVGGGFVFYDPETQKITLRRRLVKQAMAAIGERDYDVLQIVSRVEMGNSAELDYNTKQLRVNGVSYFSLSDSQKVDVFPKGYIVYAQGDRNLRFGGLMRAGIANLLSDGYDRFEFQYDNFKVYCDSIDYLQFKTERHPDAGKIIDKNLLNALAKLKIEGIKGAVYVNRPNNKSGLKPFSEYPVFDCYTISYKYWTDSSQYNNGLYRRNRLNFALDPFVIDSLENFNIRNLKFQGEYYCGEIMPSFRDTLKPVRDDTYGIDQLMPEGGVPLYDGKGTFENRVIVDGSAMWGDGTIHYLGTHAVCDSFIFHFDSVFSATYTQEFHMDPGALGNTNYPKMEIEKIKYKWYPKKDELVLETDKEPATMFGGEALFRGEIKITPDGVKGAGLLEIGNVQIESDFIDFNEMSVDVKDGTLVVADTAIPTKQHFKGEKLAINYDVENHTSKFQSIASGRDNMIFPGQRWASNIGTGDYDRNTGILTLRKKLSQSKAYFRAQNPEQLSLAFMTDSVVYNQNTEELKSDGTDSILVADAAIFPKGGKITVSPTGKIERLDSSRVIANLDSRYHELVDAKINIISSINYTGQAKYEYKDFGSGPQFITLANVGVRASDTTSVASGLITGEQEFLISNKIIYRNKVALDADKRFLAFDGEVKIQTSNPALRNAWIAFRDTFVNPDSVFVPIAKDITGSKTVGLHWFSVYRDFYQNFLQPRRNDKGERDVLLASGFLTVDPQTLEFAIGPRKKLEQKSWLGNVVAYDDSTRTITSRGYLDFPAHYDKDLNQKDETNVKFEWAGAWRQQQQGKNAKLNMALAIDFPQFPDGGTTELIRKFRDMAINNEDVDVTSRLFQESMAEFIAQRSKTPEEESEIKKLINALETMVVVRQFNVAEYVPVTFLLSGVHFTYCDSLKIFYHDGPVGIVGVSGKSFNKVVKGKISYHPGRRMVNREFRPDTLKMYLAVDPDEFEYVFLEFTNNTIRTVSSNPIYNDKMLEAGEKAAKKGVKDKSIIQYQVVSDAVKEQFLQSFSRYILSPCAQDLEFPQSVRSFQTVVPNFVPENQVNLDSLGLNDEEKPKRAKEDSTEVPLDSLLPEGPAPENNPGPGAEEEIAPSEGTNPVEEAPEPEGVAPEPEDGLPPEEE